MKILQIMVDQETSVTAKTIAKSEGLSLSAYVRRLILKDIAQRKLTIIHYDNAT